MGFISDLRWTRDEVEGEGTPLYAAPPTELLREVMEALEAAKTMTDLGGCPQKLDAALTWVENDKLARDKVDAALAKLREQLGEQG